MPAATVEVTAPSRLHFGMFSPGQPGRRQFGGVGAMIDRPGLRLRVSRAEQFCVCGPLAERAAAFARRWAAAELSGDGPRCRLEILNAPPQHVGLGVGTQLGLAVAAGLSVFCQGSTRRAVELAGQVGRGKRSAVGIHGFEQGGLIVEDGKSPSEGVAPLVERRALPAPWRFVLLRPEVPAGLFGSQEQDAFAALPPVPGRVTAQLRHEVCEAMLPCLEAQDFAGFSESVYRFGRTAGECFSAVQGGPYNGRVLSELVERIRDLGVRGVGQSSWGPTLYCLLPDQPSAEALLSRLRPQISELPMTYELAAPCNTGARISRAACGPGTAIAEHP